MLVHFSIFDSQMSVEERVRVFGINAPELRGETKEAAEAARSFALTLAPINRTAILHRTPHGWRDKYGRLLATVFVEGTDFGEAMILHGHAKPYVGMDY